MQSLTGKLSDPGPNRAAARDGASSARAVYRIADQGVSAMSKMHPDLMCSACGKTALEKCRLGVERALDAIMRDRRFSSALPDNSHFLSVNNAAADVTGDLSCERSWHTPNYCRIGAVDSAQHKVAREGVMGGLGLGDDHQPACVLVEAMDNPRSKNPANPKQTRAAMADQGVNECPIGVSRRGVDNQPCRLVDNDQMPILKADIQRNWLRNWARVHIIGKKYDEILAAPDPQRRVAQRYPFAHDMSGIDQPFEPSARESRELEGKRAIKALTVLVGAGKDGGGATVRRAAFSRHHRAFMSHRGREVSAD